MKVPFSYLDRQFADVEAYLADVRDVVQRGDFTLGREVQEFEQRFAEVYRTVHAVGVGTGTDAIAMPLKLAGVGPGDEVITTPMTFIATVGAIVQIGATPMFVDSEDGYVIDATKIEAAITPRTKAIVPVHYTGNVADMPTIADIATRHDLVVVEDACQALGATLGGQPVGSWGQAVAFSLHPLKNLNVWGDGGMVGTRSEDFADELRLFRNHGLINRDEVASFGVNCRLDTVQAAIGNRLIAEADDITEKRIDIAGRYDRALAELEQVTVPKRRAGVRHVYHLYVIRVRDRDGLLSHLNAKGVEAKIHYPVPVHLQPAAKHLGYGPGDFPICEEHCGQILTLPAHQHLTDEEVAYTIEQVRTFYR